MRQFWTQVNQHIPIPLAKLIGGTLGYDPGSLAGSDVGVFVGMHPATEENVALTPGALSMEKACTTSKFLLPNQISFHLDQNGPSHIVDSGCNASMTALNNAVMAIKYGQCSSAIVASSHQLQGLSPAVNTFEHTWNKLTLLFLGYLTNGV